TVFLGLGVVLADTGTIIADEASLADQSDGYVALPDGTKVRAFVSSRNDATGIAYLAAATSTSKGPIAWKAAQFASADPSLGQTVILVSGKSSTRVFSGLVSALSPLSDANVAPNVIETDLSKDGIIAGSPIINTDGTVVGFSSTASRSVDASGFIPGAAL